jgi:protease I
VICHGGWLPTCNAAPGVDEEVRRSRNLITSRRPDDIPALNKVLIEMLGEGKKAA